MKNKDTRDSFKQKFRWISHVSVRFVFYSAKIIPCPRIYFFFKKSVRYRKKALVVPRKTAIDSEMAIASEKKWIWPAKLNVDFFSARGSRILEISTSSPMYSRLFCGLACTRPAQERSNVTVRSARGFKEIQVIGAELRYSCRGLSYRPSLFFSRDLFLPLRFLSALILLLVAR